MTRKPNTTDYEHLLKLENVVGVEYDEQKDRVVVFVTKKLPEELLNDKDIVSRNVRGDTDVIESGELRELPALVEEGDTLAEGHQSKHRPVVGGVSEGRTGSYSTGTGGPYPATVTDPESDHWDPSADVQEGDVVRVSNAHVYSKEWDDPEGYGASISQPSPADGGGHDSVVGDVIGVVPVEDGITTDCAARRADPDQEANDYLNIDVTEEVRRSYDDLSGTTVTKSGRTSGVDSAPIAATSASVRVSGVLFRDQLITDGSISEPGDSGSAVFDEDGKLTGLLFAGGSGSTILCKIANVEENLGVEFGPLEDEDENEDDDEDEGHVCFWCNWPFLDNIFRSSARENVDSLLTALRKH